MPLKKEHIYFLKIISASILVILASSSFLFWIISGGLEKLSPDLPMYIFLLLGAVLFFVIFIFFLGLAGKQSNKNKSVLTFIPRSIANLFTGDAANSFFLLFQTGGLV